MNKFNDEDLGVLATLLKEFRAGAIDKQLDKHIDKSLTIWKDHVRFKHRPWWKVW